MGDRHKRAASKNTLEEIHIHTRSHTDRPQHIIPIRQHERNTLRPVAQCAQLVLQRRELRRELGAQVAQLAQVLEFGAFAGDAGLQVVLRLCVGGGCG